MNEIARFRNVFDVLEASLIVPWKVIPMSAHAQPDANPTLTPTEERNLRAVSDVLHYWNTQDVEGILAYYDEDIRWTNVALEEVYAGKDEVRAFINRLLTAFPDLSFEVTEKFARDDNISERWYIRGTHQGPFMGIPATGKRVEIPGISMVKMRGGKFLSDWYLFDASGGLRQMGLLPPLSASETPIMRAALWAAVHRKLVGAGLGAFALIALVVRRVMRS
ncbi:MAG: ester cyclase [Chloroflexota bacterium]|nr:ester cyclase [Chloroflexota bacterium]